MVFLVFIFIKVLCTKYSILHNTYFLYLRYVNAFMSTIAFKWWVAQTSKNRNSLISKFRSKASPKKIKFGVVVQTTVEEALHLDSENGDKLWQEAIAKEMANSRVAFHILGEG